MGRVLVVVLALAGCATVESKSTVPGEFKVAPAEVPRYVRAPESLEVWVRPEDLPRRMRP